MIRNLRAPTAGPVAAMLGVALVFGALAYFGVAMTRDQSRIAAVWLPNAVLVAILLRRPQPDLLLVAAAFVANVVSNLLAGDPVLRALALSGVNSVEILLICFGMRRLGRSRPNMEDRGDLIAFCLIAGGIAPAVAGVLASLVLPPVGSFRVDLWLTWWLTDALGLLIVAPALWIGIDTWRGRIAPSPASPAEWTLVLGVTIVATLLIFGQTRFPLLYIAAPFVLLAAFRLGALGSAAATTLIAVIAWIATQRGLGPMTLVRGEMSDRLHVLQGFLAVSFFMSLPVAAALARREAIAARLRASEAENRLMLDNMREVIFRTDEKGRWVFLNPAWEALTGYTVEESIGWFTTRLLHPDDLATARTVYPDLVSGRIGECTLGQRFFRKSGESAFIEVSVRALRGPDGAFIGTTGNIRDVTEKKLAELALVERDQQLSLLADNATDAVFRLTLTGDCIYASPSAERLLGIPPHVLVGEHMLVRFHPDDREAAIAAFEAVASGEQERRIVAYRIEQVREPGQYRWLDAHLGLVRDPVTRAPLEVIASLRDISEAKALEDELRLARIRAENATQAKAAFLANMSHEIRTPMNAVIGFTDLLLAGDLRPDQRRPVELIADSGRAMMRLLNDILDISKIEAGQMHVAEEPVDLPHLMRGAIRLMEPVSRAKGLTLDLDIDPAIPATIGGDPLRLRQILLNLIGNAVKFTESGGVVVRARALGETLRLEVEDSGIGIDPSRLSLIFDKFAQADLSIARRFGGTGLGLSISSHLVKLMGGTIEVTSKPAKGTLFAVTLPLRRRAPGHAPTIAPKSAVPARAPTGRQPRVLVAEDHDINQELMLAIAARIGIDATIASDGEDAIAKVEAANQAGTPFDLVLMDVQMPRLDGLEATRRLRAAGYGPDRLPIVALTANAYADDVAICLAAGMQHHLAKPVSAEDLLAVLGRLIPASSLAQDPPPPAPVAGLEQRFRERKARLFAEVEAVARSAEVTDEAIATLAGALHQFAGVAGMFGEPELGEAAAELELTLETTQGDARIAAAAAWLDRFGATKRTTDPAPAADGRTASLASPATRPPQSAVR
ncbi:hypothetical protein COC42_07290 [Sphingomonas spermidinifaciens]|uniref:histidine kinase n=1 Tax=Sphingomonas spermidinifaciens TaxID=1141889 RepID=A0A2A4B8I3_9SPHN|nr:PAS domain S-box protein [Sphingomonas spermidinifaciens]PCD04099.1 hypothetical protein COC42_07290 [Sphingomonas spermidinifaciens]